MTLFAFYVVVITLGILSMGFQLLASRLLNPHFGSSIIVWAWLISTFLAAFSIGSMVGGWISNLSPAGRAKGQWVGVILAVVTLLLVALFGRTLLGKIEIAFEDMSTALLVSCVGIFFLPVAALST
ncbi:MAG: fused MFS/spermidine synthase, partial [Verrucomicrobiota bacterium]